MGRAPGRAARAPAARQQHHTSSSSHCGSTARVIERDGIWTHIASSTFYVETNTKLSQVFFYCLENKQVGKQRYHLSFPYDNTEERVECACAYGGEGIRNGDEGAGGGTRGSEG